jgi:branched-chain amino acid aminotransferase
MSDAPLIWLNGRLLPEAEAQLSIFDRGFTLGDGVFETLRVKAGRPLWLADHLARLREGAGLLGIPVPMDEATIESGLISLIEARGHLEAALRVTLSRGPSKARGIWPPASPMTPTLLATLNPLPSASRPPIKLIVARSVRRNEHSPLSLIKSLNYGDNILARREAESNGADDALMLNGWGRLTCATVGNIFIRLGSHWLTPPLSEGVLAGTARRRLIPLLGAIEHPIDDAELKNAEVGLVSNSLGLTAIREVDGRSWGDAEKFAASLPLFEEQ